MSETDKNNLNIVPSQFGTINEEFTDEQQGYENEEERDDVEKMQKFISTYTREETKNWIQNLKLEKADQNNLVKFIKDGIDLISLYLDETILEELKLTTDTKDKLEKGLKETLDEQLKIEINFKKLNKNIIFNLESESKTITVQDLMEAIKGIMGFDVNFAPASTPDEYLMPNVEIIKKIIVNPEKYRRLIIIDSLLSNETLPKTDEEMSNNAQKIDNKNKQTLGSENYNSNSNDDNNENDNINDNINTNVQYVINDHINSNDNNFTSDNNITSENDERDELTNDNKNNNNDNDNDINDDDNNDNDNNNDNGYAEFENINVKNLYHDKLLSANNLTDNEYVPLEDYSSADKKSKCNLNVNVNTSDFNDNRDKINPLSNENQNENVKEPKDSSHKKIVETKIIELNQESSSNNVNTFNVGSGRGSNNNRNSFPSFAQNNNDRKLSHNSSNISNTKNHGSSTKIILNCNSNCNVTQENLNVENLKLNKKEENYIANSINNDLNKLNADNNLTDYKVKIKKNYFSKEVDSKVKLSYNEKCINKFKSFNNPTLNNIKNNLNLNNTNVHNNKNISNNINNTIYNNNNLNNNMSVPNIFLNGSINKGNLFYTGTINPSYQYNNLLTHSGYLNSLNGLNSLYNYNYLNTYFNNNFNNYSYANLLSTSSCFDLPLPIQYNSLIKNKTSLMGYNQSTINTTLNSNINNNISNISKSTRNNNSMNLQLKQSLPSDYKPVKKIIRREIFAVEDNSTAVRPINKTNIAKNNPKLSDNLDYLTDIIYNSKRNFA